jgi:hypothetical protein
MKEKYLSSQKMYHISTGCYCGVVVPLDIMKKAQKILLKAESELKNLLLQNKDKAASYSWSLSNIMDGDKILKQKTFSYSSFDAWSTIEKRIESLKLAEPQICEEFYIIENQNQLEEIKDDIREELEEELNKEKPNE